MSAKITDKEISKATKLASRKAGVTRKQLADALGITESRAKGVLEKIGAKTRAAGVGFGKANRTLIYSA